MSRTILLYGADEYLGGLFVAEAMAVRANAPGSPPNRLLIAGRNAARVQALGQQLGLQVRTLELCQPQQLQQQLADVDVLVNAASPFAETAVVLAQAAMCAPCHIVDLNPEVDVFVALGKLRAQAEDAHCAIVRSAGAGCVALALMARSALLRLRNAGMLETHCVGAMRIGMQCVRDFTRSSAASVWRALSRDVTVMRAESVPVPGDPAGETRMCRDHVPIGMLEHVFDFSVHDDAASAPPPPDRCIASAANLVDTLACSEELKVGEDLAGTVESYVSAGRLGRIAYHAGASLLAVGTPLAAAAFGPSLQRGSNALLGATPESPPALCPHTIVLQVEDQERTPLIDWRLRTPDFYLTGARAALAVAESLADQALAGGGYGGLVSPASLLTDSMLQGDPPQYGRALRDSVIDRRLLPQPPLTPRQPPGPA